MHASFNKQAAAEKRKNKLERGEEKEKEEERV